MSSEVFFSSMAFSKYNPDETLPAKFERMLKASGIAENLKGKKVAIKIHVGAGLTFSTIPPVFLRILARFVHESGGECFFTDHYVASRHPEHRGYTAENLGAPVLDDCGYFGKYFYTKEVDYKSFHHVDIAGLIHDADFLIDFSHVKGHGSCGMGGACKNIAMGCVTDRTRHQIHSLEGGLEWDADACLHCGECITNCNHGANSFDENGVYQINYHNCTVCQHCVKVCPTNAIKMTDGRFSDFQKGMAICTKTVLDTFEPQNIFFINLLTQITAVCDCWGMTTPALVPDIGIMASRDIAAIEKATLDAIKIEDLIPQGLPAGTQLSGKGHLFEQLHGKDPFVQIKHLEDEGLGTGDYYITKID